IGHGVRSYEDEALMAHLAKEDITLELCPTSNLDTRIFDCIESYPLRDYLDAGITITINTDNMTVSNTTIQKEYLKIIESFSLGPGEVRALLMNLMEASFA
ncbi:MAG: adenosine deaminase, partial [Eubacterium aggregans]